MNAAAPVKSITAAAQPAPSDVLAKLLTLARAALAAADNSEEVQGPEGRSHLFSAQDFDDLSDALEALDEIDAEHPHFQLNGPLRAEIALLELGLLQAPVSGIEMATSAKGSGAAS